MSKSFLSVVCVIVFCILSCCNNCVFLFCVFMSLFVSKCLEIFVVSFGTFVKLFSTR